MSRIGKSPIKIPENVTLKVEGGMIMVRGEKGKLERNWPKNLKLQTVDGSANVIPLKMDRHTKALHGTFRAHLANMVTGVTQGWSKVLELVGTGYKAELNGDNLVINVGFSHPVEFSKPEGINFTVEKTKITVEGIDKEAVGLTAAKIRDIRPPEPYKGKGIRYTGEIVRRKPGKAAKAEGAAA